MPELFIFLVVVEGQYRDAIIHVHAKAEGAIVNYNHVFEASIGYNAQIFDQAIFGLNTVLTIESICKDLTFWIKVVKN